MAKYIIKRLLQGIVTLFIVSTLVFILMRALPTDYFFTETQLMKYTPEQKQAALEAAGLTDPIVVQLKDYYVRVLQGDLGISRRIQSGVPVTQLIGSKILVSMQLGIMALILSLAAGTLIGFIQTLYKDKLGDHLGTAFTVCMTAVPGLVSFSLILILGTRLFHLPTLYSARTQPVLSVIMPVICLSLAPTASYALWSRRYMVDELNKDYVQLALGKGQSTKQVIFKHVLKNAFVPLVQYLPASILETLGGSLLVERFFSIPGMGPLLSDAIQKYDVDVVQTLVILYAALGILGVMFGDILMTVIDPRISLAKEGEKR